MTKIFLIAIIPMFLCSCLTTKKTKSLHSVETDSVSSHTLDEQGIRLTQTTTVKAGDSSFTETFSVEIDTTALAFISSEEDPVQRANDLAGSAKEKPKKKKWEVEIKDGKVTSNVPLKSVKKTTSGSVKNSNSVSEIKKDSGQRKENGLVQLKKVEKHKDKQIEREVSPLLFIAAGGLGLSLILYLLKLWPFSFLFTRKKQKDE